MRNFRIMVLMSMLLVLVGCSSTKQRDLTVVLNGHESLPSAAYRDGENVMVDVARVVETIGGTVEKLDDVTVIVTLGGKRALISSNTTTPNEVVSRQIKGTVSWIGKQAYVDYTSFVMAIDSAFPKSYAEIKGENIILGLQ